MGSHLSVLNFGADIRAETGKTGIPFEGFLPASVRREHKSPAFFGERGGPGWRDIHHREGGR